MMIATAPHSPDWMKFKFSAGGTKAFGHENAINLQPMNAIEWDRESRPVAASHLFRYALFPNTETAVPLLRVWMPRHR